jgi:predicted transcriptional regulator
MQVYYKTHTAYCFSSNCKTHGKSLDVIDFILHKENTTKHDALLKAQELISPSPLNSLKKNLTTMSKEQPTLNRVEVLQNMFQYFKNAVHNSKPAKEYIKSRELDTTKIEIGYNTAQFHHGARRSETLINNCVSVGLLSPLGTSKTGEQAYKPFAKYCIVFALRNRTNQITGLYFRSSTNPSTSSGQAATAKHFYLKESTGLYPNYPNPNTEKLIITESIIDTASLLQIEAIAKEYSLLAAYGTNRLNDEMKTAISELKQLKEIIFAFDNDAAGGTATVKYANELNALLPHVTISKLELPCKDVNETLQAHSEDIFLHLLETKTNLFLSTENQLQEKNTTTETVIKTSIAEENKKSPLRGNLEGINTSNPEYITYQKEALKFTLLGGFSLQQIDRLRVTLKLNIEPQLSPLQSIRHNIDLYNDDQVEKFCRKAAEKLEIGTSQILQAISELIEALEHYRLSKMESQKEVKPKQRILSDQQKQAALDYLKAPQLLKRTNQDIAKTGVIGEEVNRLLMFLVFTSRLREQPLHIISLGASGTGKTYLQEKIAELIPEQDKLEITILSDNAFYYFGQKELQNKLILIEDMDGAENVLYPLRELMSKRRITKRVVIKDNKGNMRTINLQVEGPICVAGTTTRERIYEDNANRSLLLYLDGSKQHQEKIMDYQRRASAGKINAQDENQLKELLKDIQSLLKPIPIRNPYAEQLKIPQEVFKPLRTNTHYLQFIECITFYHQYQRAIKTDKNTGNPYIETTLEDIAAANALLKDILLAKADELTGACRTFFEVLKIHLKKEERKSFYANEIRAAMKVTPTTLKRYLYQLMSNGYIKIVGGDKFRKGYEYEIVSYEEYSQLQNNIKNALDEALEQIKENVSRSLSVVQ